MHFEVLAEDESGKIALEHFLEKLVGPNGEPHTHRVISYKGIGDLPRDLAHEADPRKRILLQRLPSLLRGYGKTFASYGPEYHAVIIVVCDLDNRDLTAIMEELIDLLESCNPKPVTAFRFAIEESEAWLLGDRFAVELAYPRAKQAILDTYVQDSICGTWELLADAIHERGAVDLVRRGYPDIGIAKCEWAERIGRLVDIQRNQSPSFAKFREAVRSFAGAREVP